MDFRIIALPARHHCCAKTAKNIFLVSAKTIDFCQVRVRFGLAQYAPNWRINLSNFVHQILLTNTIK
jgi:hypothetical protein